MGNIGQYIVMTLAALLLVVSVTGCPLAQKQYVTDHDITRADGTVIPAGTPIYLDEQGEPTTTPTNTPAMETDVEKLEGIVNKGTSLADALPYGIGAIIGAIGMAGVNAARSSRAKKRAKVDAKLAEPKKEPVVAT